MLQSLIIVVWYLVPDITLHNAVVPQYSSYVVQLLYYVLQQSVVHRHYLREYRLKRRGHEQLAPGTWQSILYPSILRITE